MFSEKKTLGHVPPSVVVPRPILMLGVGATSTMPAFPDIAVVISVNGVPANPAIATDPGVTEVQVAASRVAFDQFLSKRGKCKFHDFPN